MKVVWNEGVVAGYVRTPGRGFLDQVCFVGVERALFEPSFSE